MTQTIKSVRAGPGHHPVSTQELCGDQNPGRALELAGFGQFDFDPQFDFGQDSVEPGVTRR